MKRSRLVGAFVTLTLLAGCAAGFDATASKPYAPSDGVQADSGDIRVLNALVVSGEDGRTGVVSATVVNRGDDSDGNDRLTGVTSPDATIVLAGTGDLMSGSAVTLGSGTDPTASVTDLTKAAGETMTLEFSFARTEPVTLRTVVVAATGDYAEMGPSPATSPPSP